MPDLGKVKYGDDEKLEKRANVWLKRGVGRNRRSPKRDKEKMAFELGLLSRDELKFYDPTNDWDTRDEVPVTPVSDIENVEPSQCTDGNVRARSREDPNLPDGTWGRAGEEERRGLTRHVGDDDSWGSCWESIPLLGANDGERKTCAKCGRSKGLTCFSPDVRNKDGLHSWCKPCRKEITSQKRNKRRSSQ